MTKLAFLDCVQDLGTSLFLRALLLAALIPVAAQATAPVPLVNEPLAPTSVKPGGESFTLIVNGAGFVSTSVVRWNGEARSTTFLSTTRLTATISASDILVNGTSAISVFTPAPGGGESNVVFFQVTNTHAPKFKQAVYGTGANPVGGATGDFNGDGNLDLAIANLSSGTVSILLGNGDGTFRAKTDLPTGSGPRSVAIADFNRDGILDLAVANVGTSTVSILLGNGDGTFRPKMDFATGSHSRFVAVGDLNRDGKLDLITANNYAGTMSVLLGNGDGTFAPKVDYNAGGGPYWVSLGDLNGDGNLDIMVLDYDTSGGHGSVAVFLGRGDGTFLSRTFYATGPQPQSIAFADFNGDGHLDLVTGNEGNGTISVLLGNGNGSFRPEMDFSSGASNPFVIGSMDANADNRLDIVLPHALMFGNGNGTFSPPQAFSPPGIRQIVLFVGDFNKDGKLDVVTGNIDYSSITVSIQE